MKLIVNKCFGGFELSYDAVMRYAKIKGIDIFAFVDEQPMQFDNRKMVEYKGGEAFLIHYATKPLVDGKYQDDSYFSERDIERNDPALIQVVEELKDKANGRYAQLEVVEIPDGTDWQIKKHDGNEWVAEAHRTW